MKILLSIILSMVLLNSCGKKPTTKEHQIEANTPAVQLPVFNADSAYFYVKTQVDFGPRVPATLPHAKCASYLSETLQRFGATVIEQQGEATLYDGRTIALTNIIGSFLPEKKERILLCAHWDSRPYADMEEDPSKLRTPILGANDGASGVGVLLEVARQIGKQNPTMGVDIIFFDLEDWGTPEFYQGKQLPDTWCLGSQYWGRNKHQDGYRAQYGILLDMVGAPAAKFYKEQVSTYYAPHIVEKVWHQAHTLGFDTYFINQQGGAITDDHVYVNQLANIPCINIIQYDPESSTGFGTYWHTHDDTMRHIDKNTLYVVGQTVLSMLY